MVILKDNFLPEDIFYWLTEKAKNKSIESYNLATKKTGGRSKFYAANNTAWDLGYSKLNGDIMIPHHVLGQNFKVVYDKILNVLQENSITPLDVDAVFFMFAISGYKIHKHTDIRYSDTTSEQLNKIVKSFIFCHDKWDDSWGGELCFLSGEYKPLPNRLVIYTADELHWVNEVNNINDNKRMIFGIRFGDR